MKIALVDSRMSRENLSGLEKHCDGILKLPPFSRLAVHVAAHPDMLVFAFGKSIYTWEEYLCEQKGVFGCLEDVGYEIKTVEEKASPQYPDDVRLNCALVGKRLIAGKRGMSKTLLSLARKEGLSVLPVNQGYAKCSTAVVSGNAVITADISVFRACENEGISVLKISHGNIALDGYGEGFIGGATGADGENVYFCGDLSTHPDGERIEQFCKDNGKRAVSLCKLPLYDYGTVIFV